MGIPYSFYKTLTPFDRKTGKAKRAESSVRTNDEGSGWREWPVTVGEEGTIDQDGDETWDTMISKSISLAYASIDVNVPYFIRVFTSNQPPTISPPAQRVFRTILGFSNWRLAVSQS